MRNKDEMENDTTLLVSVIFYTFLEGWNLAFGAGWAVLWHGLPER